MSAEKFAGFPAATRKFLRELERNNVREWFQANKSRYERDVVEPALQFIAAMQQPIAAVSEQFTALPQRTGGSLMRVYRDSRFSKDKTPYKTNVGIQFRHAAGKDVHAPGFYVHIEAKQAFLGAGVWHPDAKALAAIRLAIVDEPAAWQRARHGKPFTRHFELEGESLKRPPRGIEADHPLIEDLKRKDFIGVCRLDPAEVESPDFVKRAAAAFKASGTFVARLCDAVGIPF